MSEDNSVAKITGKLLGWACGVICGSVIYTYLGITVLNHLGWMP